MTDNEHIKPLDLSRYEGHPDAKHWLPSSEITRAAESIASKGTGSSKEVSAAQNLIADAPLLLAEVRRLREALQAASRAMNDEWVKYYERGMSAPASLKEAVNGAIRVLGEEGGER